MQHLKQNINPRKCNGKFQSFENTRDDKFSIYKIQKNLLVGRSDDYHNEINYNEQEECMVLKNVKKIQQEHVEQQVRDDVDNLHDLWNKLGNEDIQDESQKNQKNEVIELTDQELLYCFGQDSSRNDQNQENQQNQVLEAATDDDLMAIWGENTADHQNSLQDDNLASQKPQSQQKIPKQSQKLQIQWEQCEVQQNRDNFVAKNTNKNVFDDDELELQDPNFIDLNQTRKKIPEQKSQNKNEKKDNEDSKLKPESQKENEISRLDQKTKNDISLSPQGSTQLHNNSNNHLNLPNSNSSLPIQTQIILENNNKSMIKLIPTKDYQIFDTKLFSLSLFKPNTYSYFGIEGRKQSLIDPEVYSQSTGIQYFHCFETGQALLELRQQPFRKQWTDYLAVKKVINTFGQKIVKKVMQYNNDVCYTIRVCSTKQHIATIFYKVLKDGFLFDLRLYDQYEGIMSSPIALIQVKDGYANECCYCDTNVYIQKRNQKQSLIEKLRMILNLKNGKLTANMGINGIQSSPYNCCLQNAEKKFIYLMGLLIDEKKIEKKNNQNIDENEQKQQIKSNQHRSSQSNPKSNKNKFIVKIGEGLSPLLCFAISASRKIYIDSFE